VLLYFCHMANYPQVSVVIPTYNRAEMLRGALESVRAQTVPASQVAVVDDGSTDHTVEVVRDFASSGLPIVYLTGPHRDRLGEARNRGVEATGGEWIAFLDSDDIWKPERLRRQLDAIARMPYARFAFCNLHRFDENGLIGSKPYLSPSADYNGRILGHVLEEPVVVPSAFMVRRDAFKRFGGFSGRQINEDYELIVKLAAEYRACYVPETLVLHRAHGGNRSMAQRRRSMLEYLDIVQGFLAGHPNLPLDARVRGRRGLANVHFKLARFYIEAGDRQAARRHLRSLVRIRPWDRRAFLAYLASFRNSNR